jgi:hypothetical protein
MGADQAKTWLAAKKRRKDSPAMDAFTGPTGTTRIPGAGQTIFAPFCGR